MLRKEIAAQLFEHLCNHNWHGYSQPHRYGDGEGTCDITINGKVYKLEQGDRDCSSAIISAFEAAGISCGGATYTGNMKECMTSTGNFVWHPMSSGFIAQRSDVYLNILNHTAMCTSAVPDMLGEFSMSETGGIDGATGDQTGKESYIHAYYDFPWDGILECVCTLTDDEDKKEETTSSSTTEESKTDSKNESKDEVVVEQVPGKNVNNYGIKYTAYSHECGKQVTVHDGQTCGILNSDYWLEGLYIDNRSIKKKYPKSTLSAKVCIRDNGWKEYINVSYKTLLGMVNKGTCIEAIELEMYGLPKNKVLKYRTYLDGVGWTDWINGGFASGTIGIRKPILAIQIKIV